MKTIALILSLLLTACGGTLSVETGTNCEESNDCGSDSSGSSY